MNLQNIIDEQIIHDVLSTVSPAEKQYITQYIEDFVSSWQTSISLLTNLTKNDDFVNALNSALKQSRK